MEGVVGGGNFYHLSCSVDATKRKRRTRTYFVLKIKTPHIMMCTNKLSYMHNSIFSFDFHCSGSMILEVLKILVNSFSGEKRMRNSLCLLPQR